MNLETKIISPGSATEEDYRSVIGASRESTVLHSIEWRDALAETLGDPPVYFVCYDAGAPAGVLPAFVRTTTLGAVLNSLPLSGSYGGVCLHKDAENPEAVFEKLQRAALDYARSSRCLTATFVMSPLRPGLRSRYINTAAPDYIYDRFTQLTDLTAPLAYKPSVKNHIRKARKQGVEVSRELSEGNMKLFYDIYCANMGALGLDTKPRAFFDSVARNMCEKGKARFYFAFAGGEMVSGLLVFLSRRGVMSHETVFERRHAKYQGNSLLLDTALRDAVAAGCEYFNWGASADRECGVYRFKKAWGAREAGYSYFTYITGDCEPLRRAGAENILREFSRFYYVIPFSHIGA